jgi:hypothetical protein
VSRALPHVLAGALVAAAALLVAPRPAHAGGSCGGGGGGDSGGGDSGGGDSGGYDYGGDSGSSDTTPACRDSTDVVGYRECTKFGTWGIRLPHVFLELGSQVRQFPSALGAREGSVSHGLESFAYRIVAPEQVATRDTAATASLRVSTSLRRGVYVGVEGEIGGLTTIAPVRTEMTTSGTYGSPQLAATRGMMLGGLGLVGLRGATRFGTLSLEGAGGMRDVRYTFASSYHGCETTSTIGATLAVLEARGRGELWLSPWLSAGATIGASLIDRGDWMAGFYLGVHTRSFGKSR